MIFSEIILNTSSPGLKQRLIYTHSIHYAADIFNAVKNSLETVMQCLCWSLFLSHNTFFFFYDMWIPAKTSMKIPQGLFKKT